MTDAQLPDPVASAVDLITELLDETGENVDVGTDLPSSWKPSSKPFMLVAVDLIATTGTWPIYADCTTRVTSYAAVPSESRRLALLCHGLLISRGARGQFSRHRHLTGPLTDRDKALKADFASFTVRSTLRTEPLALGS